MTAEEIALVETIHADPQSDAPRVAYAEWLERHGAAEYAEFIRLQCEQPYVAISTRDEPRCGTSYEFPWNDDAANGRLKRLITLYPQVLVSERLAPFRQDYYFQEFRGGLALWEVDGLDLSPAGRVCNPLAKSPVTIPAPPLLRFRFCLQTTAEALVSWLKHPSMRRVDELRLRIERNHETFDAEPFVDLSSVDFSFFQGLEKINLGQVPAGLSGRIAGKAHAAGVIVSYDY
jgi:uncharacterized protein (TIGR02996 family)